MSSKDRIGILAYGSLIGDPGFEINPLIMDRISIITPFQVEYGRISGTRGGAPTVVPHPNGKPVKAEILVLFGGIDLKEAQNMLYRREIGKEGSGKKYNYSSGVNAVVISDEPGYCDVKHVLYTDFNREGKISTPNPRDLADLAVKSVNLAKCGKDGISYLINLISKGVHTKLTKQYKKEILALTQSSSLSEALNKARYE